MIYYITKQDDTLPRISAKLYGDWTLWYLIYDNNRLLISDRFNLQSGLMLEIPIPSTQIVNHTIVDGDSYHSLALDYYGSEHYFYSIKAKNNSLVLNENIGKKIIIPALISSSVYTSAQELIGV